MIELVISLSENTVKIEGPPNSGKTKLRERFVEKLKERGYTTFSDGINEEYNHDYVVFKKLNTISRNMVVHIMNELVKEYNEYYNKK